MCAVVLHLHLCACHFGFVGNVGDVRWEQTSNFGYVATFMVSAMDYRLIVHVSLDAMKQQAILTTRFGRIFILGLHLLPFLNGMLLSTV